MLGTIDVVTGGTRAIYEVPANGPRRTLWPELSNSEIAVVGYGLGLLYAFGDRTPVVSADVVEIATGQVFPNALTIPSPITP